MLVLKNHTSKLLMRLLQLLKNPKMNKKSNQKKKSYRRQTANLSSALIRSSISYYYHFAWQ